MSQVWLTSDLHLGHPLVSQLRGHPSVAAHDASVLAELRAHVRPEDTFWILGDVALGDRHAGLSSLWSVPCTSRHLVSGNHDYCHPAGHRRSHEHSRDYTAVFDSVNMAGVLRGNGLKFHLSHFPYAGEGDRDMPDRHVQWRLRDCGADLIHGHTHDTVKARRSPKGSRMINVCWEAWGRPVTLDEVCDLVLKLP
ncbi:metallophosphoesterase [Janibacter melonis]|uniref:metallophosphoesterase n=1 Tax=Janibacter melonis TaxID=262209 RepID=UPI0019192BC0|nr:metallophosphoesterase [Janibacter melonis]